MRVLKGALAAVAFCFIASAASSQQICDDYTTEAALFAAKGADWECRATPEQVEFTIHDISLCTSLPDVGLVGSCTSIFNSPSGKKVLVSDSTKVPLDPNISLENGDYSHVVLTLDEWVGIKVILGLQFTVDGERGTSGTHCWSNGDLVVSYDVTGFGNVRCGTLQTAMTEADMSYESITTFEDENANYAPTNVLNDEPSGNGGTFNISLIDTAGQLANDLNNDGFYTDTDKLFVVIPLSSVQRVDDNSTNIDVGFKVNNLVNMKMELQNPGVHFQTAGINSISFYATIE